MMRTILLLLLFMTAASAQTTQPTPAEQRLGATIGALIVENNRLVIALDEANRTIAQLRAEIQTAKNPPSPPPADK